MKRVCFLLNNEFTCDNRVEREAKSLVKAGYDVTLIATQDFEKELPKTELREGIQIHRRIRKKLPAFLPVNTRLVRALFAIVFRYRRFDFVHAHDANMLLLGFLLARIWGAKLIYDSHELWESVYHHQREKLHAMRKTAVPVRRTLFKKTLLKIAIPRKTLLKLTSSKKEWIKKVLPFQLGITTNISMNVTSNISMSATMNLSKRMKPKRRSNFKWQLLLLGLMEQLETWLLSRCDALISVNQSLCRLIEAKSRRRIPISVPVRNVAEFYPMPSKEQCRLFHQAFSLSDETQVVLYQGNIAEIRGISKLLNAMELLNDSRIALVLMGPVSPSYLKSLQVRINENSSLRQSVFYKETVFGEELPRWTASANLGIAPILNCRASYYYCLPNKLFEYIQGNLPIAASNFPEMTQLIEDYEIGFTFDPENPEEIALKLREYFDSPELQALYQVNLAQAKSTLHWKNEEKHLIDVYRSLEGLVIPQQKPLRNAEIALSRGC